MDYKEHIKKAVEYIEDNLKNEIDISACAKAACYSEYHFLRIFKETLKLTPSDYIRKRRITEIVKKIYGQADNISELAFAYGFNSKENFTRAFKREHHILPTEYKSTLCSLKLYEPFTFNLEKFEVHPQIRFLDGFSLVVYQCDENFPPNFWNKYNSRKYAKRLSGGVVCEDYGVSLWNDEQNRLDYFIGIRIAYAHGDQSNTIQLDIPGGIYAVFATPVTTHYNFVNTIHKTWNYINRVWLPQSGYRRTGGFEFETYTEQSRIFSETIYIPLKEMDVNEKA